MVLIYKLYLSGDLFRLKEVMIFHLHEFKQSGPGLFYQDLVSFDRICIPTGKT
jgi:hypothetical protein